MRRVAAPRGVVHEPRLGRVLGAHRVQPFHGLVGEGVGHVELGAVLALGHADDRVVLRDDRVVLAGLAGEEAPEVVEAPGVRPAVERAGHALQVVGGQVPLAEAAGAVAVALQHAHERRAVLGARRRVPRERARELADGAEADGVVVAAGEQRRARRRAQRGHVEGVVRDAGLGDARHGRRLDGAAEGARVAVAGVVDEDEQDVRGAFRWRRRHVDRPVGGGRSQRAADRAAEARVGDGQHRAVGDELECGLGKGVLEAAHALLVHGDDRFGRRAGERPLGGQTVLVVDHGDDGGCTRLELLAEAALHPALDLVVHELADDSSGGGADGDGGQERRSREADEDADAASPAQALAAEVVAGLAHVDLAVLVTRDEDHALGPDLLLPDERHQRVEVLLRRLQLRIRCHDHVVTVTHGLPLRPWSRRSPTSQPRPSVRSRTASSRRGSATPRASPACGCDPGR